MAKRNSETSKEGNLLVVDKITVAQLHRTNADIGTWKDAVRSAESLTYPQRKALYELYRHALADGWLRELMRRRIRAITNIKCSWVKANGEIDTNFNKEFEKIWFHRLLQYAMQGKFFGHELIEFEVSNGRVIKTKAVPRQNVSPEFGIVYRNYGDVGGGIPYRQPPYSYYLVEFVPEDEDSLGLLLQASIYVLLKRGSMGDWAVFNEIFGSPIRQYTYDPQFPETRVQAEQAAKEAGNAAYIVLPKGVELELHNGNASGQITTYKDLREAMNEELSISIVGQTLTVAQGQKGARSLGEVHQEVQEAMHKEDRKEISYWLNETVVPVLRNLGYELEDGGSFVLDDTQVLPLEIQLEMDLKLNEIIPIDADYFYEKYKIPKPKNSTNLAEKKQRVHLPNPTAERDSKKKNLKLKSWFTKS